MNKLTPFVINKIEEKLGCGITNKGACAELRRYLYNSESEDGRFSLNTIKRWFGVIERQVEPQQTGLEAIAEYLGYPSWAALTQENDYSQQKEKTEDDYISEIFSDYKSLVKSINEYKFKMKSAKGKSEFIQCKTKWEELKNRQRIIKDAIVKLSDLLTDPTPYQSDTDNLRSLFNGNRYEEANQLLNTDTLKEEQAVLFRANKKKLSDKNEIQKQLKKNANCFYIKAEICKAGNNWDEAEEYYLLSLNSQRNFDTLFAFGEFYLKYNCDEEKAFPLLKEIIENMDEILSGKSEKFFCNPDCQVSVMIDALFYVGKIDFMRKHFDEGFKKMDLVLEIYKMDKSHVLRKDIQIAIGHVYNEQGNAFLTQNDYKKAELFYKKALEIYKPFSKFDSLGTLINLAYVYADKGDFESAESKLNQSLEYFNSMFDKKDSVENRQKYLLRIAKCFYALGYLYSEKQDLEKSIIAYKRAGLTYCSMDEIAPSRVSTFGSVDIDIILAKLHQDLDMNEKAASYRYTILFMMQTNDMILDYVHKQHSEFFQTVGKILDDMGLLNIEESD